MMKKTTKQNIFVVCAFVAAMGIFVGVLGMARKHDYANYLVEFNAQVPVAAQQTSWDNVKKIAHGSLLPMRDCIPMDIC